jgi:hypothetical protein
MHSCPTGHSSLVVQSGTQIPSLPGSNSVPAGCWQYSSAGQSLSSEQGVSSSGSTDWQAPPTQMPSSQSSSLRQIPELSEGSVVSVGSGSGPVVRLWPQAHSAKIKIRQESPLRSLKFINFPRSSWLGVRLDGLFLCCQLKPWCLNLATFT